MLQTARLLKRLFQEKDLYDRVVVVSFYPELLYLVSCYPLLLMRACHHNPGILSIGSWHVDCLPAGFEPMSLLSQPTFCAYKKWQFYIPNAIITSDTILILST